MNILSKVFFALVFTVGFISCTENENSRIKTGNAEVVDFKVISFKMDDVKLLDGPFLHATELNKQSLLNYEPDRLLAKFRTEAGLEGKAEHYHGWEDNTIAGHSLGHYLTAACLMYKTTGNQEFLNRVNYIVDELSIAQEANGNGYIGAFPDGKRILEEEVAKGDIRSRGFDLNGLWVPFYTEHKMMAGLNDAYQLCSNEKALEVNKKFADWLYTIITPLSDSLVQKMLHCEHGGINESLAELYGITGNQKYLEMSRIFHHKAILDPLSEEVDVLEGKHANTQVPKLVGLARRYELTGDMQDRKTAEFFWERVVHQHSYVTGGNGNHEYFGPPAQLAQRLSDGTSESCNVYNMLKLSSHIFEWEASPEVADFYERALFNHILSSQHPENGRVIYNLSLEMGGQKVYQDPQWFTCCVGTGMENHSKYGQNIYFHNNDELYVTQFIASELSWKEKGLVLKQTTDYPTQQGSRFEFTTEQPVKLDVLLRYPAWAEEGAIVSINGLKKKITENPGSFIRLSKKWKTGDVIELNIPFTLRLESMPDDSNRVAVMYGPLVMAGDLGPENDPQKSDPLYVPVFMTNDRNPDNWFVKNDNEPNSFHSENIGKPKDVTIRPFYATHERTYTIYWDLFNEESWSQKEQEYRASLERKKKIEEMTIDFAQLGEMQPERNHNFKDEDSNAGEFKGRKMRESRSGWFSVDMSVYKGQPMGLVAEYWGGFPGSRTFDILIDGKKIATENISNTKEGEFYFKEYLIPDELTVDKTKVKVTFKAHESNIAGPVFSVRTTKR